MQKRREMPSRSSSPPGRTNEKAEAAEKTSQRAAARVEEACQRVLERFQGTVDAKLQKDAILMEKMCDTWTSVEAALIEQNRVLSEVVQSLQLAQSRLQQQQQPPTRSTPVHRPSRLRRASSSSTPPPLPSLSAAAAGAGGGGGGGGQSTPSPLPPQGERPKEEDNNNEEEDKGGETRGASRIGRSTSLSLKERKALFASKTAGEPMQRCKDDGRRGAQHGGGGDGKKSSIDLALAAAKREMMRGKERAEEMGKWEGCVRVDVDVLLHLVGYRHCRRRLVLLLVHSVPRPIPVIPSRWGCDINACIDVVVGVWCCYWLMVVCEHGAQGGDA